MSEPLQSLWPEDVEFDDVLTPLAILKFQADELKRRTNGRLKAEIETIIDGSQTKHHFDIIAPTLNHYRYRLFSVEHDVDQVYPVEVCSEAAQDLPNEDDAYPSTQSGFTKAIEAVLKSYKTVSVISSLLARIHESSQQTTAQL